MVPMEVQGKDYNREPSKRIPMWLPYVSHIEHKKDRVKIDYKGGSVERKYSKIHSIMFYGYVPPLAQGFLEKCAHYEVPIVIHRRNMPKAVWILGSTGTMREDTLSLQIQYRNNEKKRTYTAKRLLHAKFISMEWLSPYPQEFRQRYYSLDEMRILEAHHARRYWNRYYEELGFSRFHRRDKRNTLTNALDAVSKFVYGILLRWIIYHNLSPAHGFLHEPTDYPALVYDLMEPYRGYIEKVLFEDFLYLRNEEGINLLEEDLVPYAISSVEEMLDEKVYTNATRQIVTFQELLHGSVLSLISYMERKSQKFVIPIPNKPNGGRPRKVGYRLYGRSAGLTDFWTEARELGMIYEKYTKRKRRKKK